MKSMRAVAIGIVVSVALVCAALAMAHQQSMAPASQSTDLQTGINLAKTVVTAEVVYSSSHGSFVSWDELYQSPDVQKFWQPSPDHGNWLRVQISAGPEVIPGWTLSALASPDGKSFQVAVHNSANQCGLSVYSDQTGRVYEGAYVDCVQLVPEKK
jgi:hypothetical protein